MVSGSMGGDGKIPKKGLSVMCLEFLIANTLEDVHFLGTLIMLNLAVVSSNKSLSPDQY